MRDIQPIVGLAEVAGVIILSILYIKSRLPGQTIKQQTDLISALEKRVKAMEDERTEFVAQNNANAKAIASLEGQISVYKELPLQDIAKSLKILENLPTEFAKMTEKNTSVIISAVNNIKEQHVEHQTVDKSTVKGD